jgi:large subunit ribosomal protein L7/L12
MGIAEKAAIVEDIEGRFQESKMAIFIDFSGLEANKMVYFRRSIKGSGGEMKVYKNSLISRAISRLGLEIGPISGPTGIIFCYDDPAKVAKTLMDFVKAEEKPRVKFGVLDKKAIGAGEVELIASLPPKEVLLARVIGAIAAPISSLILTLRMLIARLIYVLKAIEAQGKEVEGEVSLSREQIIESISQMTVLELSQLIKELEERFGVTASMPVAVAAPSAPAPEEKEEQTEFSVVLEGFGSNKIQVIKVIRELTGLGLQAAKEFVESAPKVVKEGISKEEAERIKAKIEEAGGQASIK